MDFESRDARFGILLIAPAVAWVFVVVVIPLVAAFSTSLTNQRTPGRPADFVGFSNYADLIADAGFRSALARSAIWVISNGLLQTAVALAVALLLNRPFIGQSFVRSWILLPWVVPSAVIAILWKWMMDASVGVINFSLTTYGLTDGPILFLSSPDNAFRSMVAINSWRLFPFIAIILLAALQSVPEDQYEAASIDGATRFMQFKSITFPHIAPTLTVLGLVGTLWAANVFDLIWMITRGGPVNTTRTAPVFIYDRAFAGFNNASASAASIVLLLFLAAFAATFVFLGRRQLGQLDTALEEVVEAGKESA
jgi:multiple sugar transport system permease protein